VSSFALITFLNKLIIENGSNEQIGLHLLAIHQAAHLLDNTDIHRA